MASKINALRNPTPGAASDSAPTMEVGVPELGNCDALFIGSIDDRHDDANMFLTEGRAIVEAVIAASGALDDKTRGRALWGAIRLLGLGAELAESTDPRNAGGDA